MKNIYFLSLILLLACSPKSNTGSSDRYVSEKEKQANEFSGTSEERLALFLRKQPGVIVSQANGVYKVRVRGGSGTLTLESGPLFIINGNSIGFDFNLAAEAIAGQKIKSVRVLKGNDASFYGARGSGGVVQIKTHF